MSAPDDKPQPRLERAVVVISLDAEQIWGHLDLLDERRFSQRYPNVQCAYERLLDTLCSGGISATWLLVGGLALEGSDGASDLEMEGLPAKWIQCIPAGNEETAPLWYRRSFVKRLAQAYPAQDLGLHGGLTHLIWTDRISTSEVIRREFLGGLQALEGVSIRPRSFSFARNQEAHHELLAEAGLLCYRGRTPVLSARLGRTLPGSILRAIEELGRATPPPVWPIEALPGLWNIPASLFLYPIGESRSRLLGLQSRLERVEQGLAAAIRHQGVFHFCLHPANLAESPKGFTLFETILERILRAREQGDVEILTMTGLASRMEDGRDGTAGADGAFAETVTASRMLRQRTVVTSEPRKAALRGGQTRHTSGY